MMDKIEDITSFMMNLFGGAIPLILSLIAINFAWTDWQLRQELNQAGILTEATIQHCSRYRRSCKMTYEFRVTVDEQIKEYVGDERVTCSKCPPVGTPVKIKYVPQNPKRSGFEKQNLVNHYIGRAILALLLYPIFGGVLYGKVIVAKYKTWLKAYRSNKNP